MNRRPLWHGGTSWCRGRESNPHSPVKGKRILSPPRMPVSPPRHEVRARSIIETFDYRKERDGGDGRIRTAESGFCRPLPWTTWLRRLGTGREPLPTALCGIRSYVFGILSCGSAPPRSGMYWMVPRARLELARPCGHSALNAACLPFQHLGNLKDGRSERTRTPDLRFWRPLLYQLSYAPALNGSPVPAASALHRPASSFAADTATTGNHTSSARAIHQSRMTPYRSNASC